MGLHHSQRGPCPPVAKDQLPCTEGKVAQGMLGESWRKKEKRMLLFECLCQQI